MLSRNNSNNYGEFEDGNQLSFKQLEQYIQTNYDGDFQFSQIIDQMKETITVINSWFYYLNSDMSHFTYNFL